MPARRFSPAVGCDRISHAIPLFPTTLVLGIPLGTTATAASSGGQRAWTIFCCVLFSMLFCMVINVSIERIGDPLTHLVRNAIDHGLERPEDRVLAGKPERGVVRLEAYQQGLPAAEKAFEEVRRLTSDNPEQQRRLDTARPLIRQAKY